MPRLLSHAVLIVAIFAATGSHWLVLQSIAWTGMLTSNLQETSFVQAFERTFDGKHPCSLCRQISQGKQAEKKTAVHLNWKKLEFPLCAQLMIFIAPSAFSELPQIESSAEQLTHTPPLPPPKTVSA